MARAIGIDLGTTYTVVATLEGGRPRVVPNAEGQRLTPSVVCFAHDGTPLVGEPAKVLAAIYPEQTVSSIKRRMGSDHRVRIEGREYTPQEVSSLILRKVRLDAERHLGEPVDRAVITVPAYFNDRQRQATKEAGIMTGLEVMRIINEPTAAALAYGLHREEAHTILVWDLGGGTFDVSILELGDGIFEVRAVSGDTWLGGDDWDSRLAYYLAEKARQSGGTGYAEDARTWQQMRALAEQAKRKLSAMPLTRVGLPIPEGHGLRQQVLTREQFEALTRDLLHRMLAPTHQALADAGLRPQEIDRVLLVGGATRMPAVRHLVREVFGKEPYRSIQPDEAVALGAAIQAGMLLGVIEKAVLLDVLPLSLGVETQGGLTTRIIPRNTPLPTSGSRIFTTAADYQTSMEIHLLQGERELAIENVSLGHFQLSDIPAGPRGLPRVEVALEVDVDGMVQLSAQELSSGGEVKVRVAFTKFLAAGEIRQMVEEARQKAAQDREARTHIEAHVEAGHLLAAVEMATSELEGLQAQHLARAASALKEALERANDAQVKALSSALRETLAASVGGKGRRP